MTDLGKMKYFLGIEVSQTANGLHVSQAKYALEVLRRFDMEESNPVRNPMVPGSKLSIDEEGEPADEISTSISWEVSCTSQTQDQIFNML